MKNPRLQFFAERINYGRIIALRFFGTSFNGQAERAYLPKPIVWEAADDDALQDYREAPLTLRPDEAQQLIDELWRAGLRPSEGTGSAGSLAATERHLADMQRIAFTLLREEQGVADAARVHGSPKDDQLRFRAESLK